MYGIFVRCVSCARVHAAVRAAKWEATEQQREARELEAAATERALEEAREAERTAAAIREVQATEEAEWSARVEAARRAAGERADGAAPTAQIPRRRRGA